MNNVFISNKILQLIKHRIFIDQHTESFEARVTTSIQWIIFRDFETNVALDSIFFAKRCYKFNKTN